MLPGRKSVLDRKALALGGVSRLVNRAGRLPCGGMKQSRPIACHCHTPGPVNRGQLVERDTWFQVLVGRTTESGARPRVARILAGDGAPPVAKGCRRWALVGEGAGRAVRLGFSDDATAEALLAVVAGGCPESWSQADVAPACSPPCPESDGGSAASSGCARGSLLARCLLDPTPTVALHRALRAPFVASSTLPGAASLESSTRISRASRWIVLSSQANITSGYKAVAVPPPNRSALPC